MTRRPSPALWVFLILFPSYAYFWHGRDWNTASRLMLTYALVDRGTLSINGLEDQTGDKAVQGSRFYSDKLPGYSLLAALPYALAKPILRLPEHPLNEPGFAYWPADYWITLLTSGLLTAATGALLASLAMELGCGPRRSVLIGLGYGLATPAAVYATLAYGHQASAFALLMSMSILWRGPGRRPMVRSGLAGFLAAYASVIELQVGPIAAILGIYLIALVIGRKWPTSSIWAFGLGALIPTLILLVYNYLAFGSPLTMGYFLHANPRFRGVHSSGNPLGLARPVWDLADDLLWGTRRGLLVYAPVLILTFPGMIVLIARRLFGLAIVSALVIAAVFLVNLSYPEWTGGWSTGPRLLVPLLPFAIVPVAALLAGRGKFLTPLLAALVVCGAAEMLLFAGVGGRIPEQGFEADGPDPFAFPLRDVVPSIWKGEPLPGWLYGIRFARDLTSIALPGPIAKLPVDRQWVQFLPLILFQVLGVGLAMWHLSRQSAGPQAASEIPPDA